MTDAEKIELLRAKLAETLSENDQLRAELARLTEGASAYETLSDIHRNRDLPAAVRTKAAIECISREMAPLAPEKAPLDLTAEPYAPLAELVSARRARADQMEREARQIRVLPNGQVLLLDESEPSGKGNGGDDTAG